jgi:hypothetical protein
MWTRHLTLCSSVRPLHIHVFLILDFLKKVEAQLIFAFVADGQVGKEEITGWLRPIEVCHT